MLSIEDRVLRLVGRSTGDCVDCTGSYRKRLLLGLIGVMLGSELLSAAAPSPSPPRRAQPPTWKDLPSGIFFEDAFEQGLVGLPASRSSGTPSVAESSDSTDIRPAASDAAAAVWTGLISAETIEDEIKAILGRINRLVANPGDFKTRGYREARREFAVAAMLFAIIDEYPQTVRWKADAVAARDAFAQAAIRSQVGSDAVFRQASQLSIALQDLVRGGSFSPQASVQPQDWSEICPRPALMQRLEQSVTEQLSSWIATPDQFRQQKPRVIRESQISAAIAHVLWQEGMEDSSDEDYRGYCQAMLRAAEQLMQAAVEERYEAARQAEGGLRRSCADCHGDYRG